MMKEPLFESSNIHSTPSFRQAMDSIHFNTEYEALRFTVVRFQFSTGGFPLNFSSFTVFSGQGLRKLPRGSSRSSLSERPPDAGQNNIGNVCRMVQSFDLAKIDTGFATFCVDNEV